MQPDAFRELLQKADGSAPRFAATEDLAASIRSRHVRRQRARRVAFACSLLVLAVPTSFVLMQDRSKTQVVRNGHASLSTDVSLHELTAAKYLALTAEQRVDAPDHPQPTVDVQFQRDRAALVMVYQANRYATDNRTD